MIPILAVLPALVLLFFLLLRILWGMAFAVRKKDRVAPDELPPGDQYTERSAQMLSMIRAALEIPFEEVYITSRDGVKLYGRLYEVDPTAPTKLMLHGYRSNAFRDFSGGLQLTMQSGQNVLLVDQRAHGKSGGRCLTFGILERYDCLDWIDFIRGRYGNDAKVILNGLSMGAATVLMASDIAPKENVIGIIADCGYSSPREIIRLVIRYMHYPVGISYALIRLSGRLLGGFDIEAATAERSVQNTQIPILFVHGEDDRFVPCEMSRRCFDACASEKMLLTVPDAGHGLSFLVDEDAYRQAIAALLSQDA